MAEGTIFKFHNDLDTDQIIASQYLLLPNLEEMKEHAFESLDQDFPKKVKPGDFVMNLIVNDRLNSYGEATGNLFL